MNSAIQTAGVLSFEEAYEVVRAYCQRILQRQMTQAEEVPLLGSLGRVLAEPVVADRDFPPFPRSTRDGYAVRSADLAQNGSALLRVVGQIKAGDSYDLPVASGEAVEIMTGAAVPQGADAVVMVEYATRKSPSEAGVDGRDGAQHQEAPAKTSSDGDDDVLEALRDPLRDPFCDPKSAKESPAGTTPEDLVEIRRATAAGENIVPAGAEAKAGQELLPKGTRLGPAQIALAAAAGKVRVKVFAKPRVAILSTGDELVDVAEKPGPSQIRNSNSYSLAALVAANGGEPVQLPIAPDEEGRLIELVQEGLKADLLLLSGGVSMGKFDLVEKVLKELGAEFFFTGAMIQPGKPVVFGARGETPFFGLPGNPVSVMVTFELFARQVVEALSGVEPQRLRSAQARLNKEFKTKTGLTRFLPGTLEGGLENPEVDVVPWQGSGDMLAAARANCYLVVPPDREKLARGEMVTVVLR
ncbi:MAG TPA: gephyrin-like molybdotransferase Glp [Candidatus Angelobacter sp.]|nr:gephyrin-like molybdotransferase Glp [Candidatus Angelobacter sp.]